MAVSVSSPYLLCLICACHGSNTGPEVRIQNKQTAMIRQLDIGE